MSDTPQGPGWWLASDGKWYPPEQWTGPPNTHPPGQRGGNRRRRRKRAAGTNLAERITRTDPELRTAAGLRPEPVARLGSAGPTRLRDPPSGATPYGQPVYVAAGGSSTNGLAIASFVCSILGFFFITFIVAIVLGFVARAQIRRSAGQQKGDGLAIAGIIIGFAWVAFSSS